MNNYPSTSTHNQTNNDSQSIQYIIQKSLFNNHIKNIPTNVKKLMLSSQSGNLIYNILPKSNHINQQIEYHRNRNANTSRSNNKIKSQHEINLTQTQYSPNQKLKIFNNQTQIKNLHLNNKPHHKPPIHPNSSKNLLTTKEWYKRQNKFNNILAVDQTQPKRISISQRQSRFKNTVQLNAPQKLDSLQKFQNQLQSSKQQIVINTEKDKSKKISRFLFELQVPSQLKQKAKYKLKKFKVVENFDDKNLIQNNSKVSNTQVVKQKKNQKQKLKSKNIIPDFIKPSLQIQQNSTQPIQISYSKEDEFKSIISKKDLVFQNQYQYEGIHSKNIQIERKNAKYFLRLKKDNDKNVEKEINTCPSQNNLMPKVQTYKLYQKSKQQKFKQRIYSQDKFRQNSIKFKKQQKSSKKALHQEINICGWQNNDNNNYFY